MRTVLSGFSDSDYAKCQDIALHSPSQEAIFLRELLQELRFLKSDLEGLQPTPIYCDEAATRISQDTIWRSNAKHFRLKYHYIRDSVRERIVKVTQVPSAGNLSDV